MAACNKSTLIGDAVLNQFTGLAPDIRDAIIIQLLCDLTGMACNKATLLSDAISNGFTGLEPRIRDALIVQLLCDINGGGGVGGGQQVYVNAGDPNGVVLHNATTPALCIDTSNNIVWTKTDGVASNTGWDSP
jgi:hypothetical protein